MCILKLKFFISIQIGTLLAVTLSHKISKFHYGHSYGLVDMTFLLNLHNQHTVCVVLFLAKTVHNTTYMCYKTKLQLPVISEKAVVKIKSF